MTAIPETTLFTEDNLISLEAQLLSAGSEALFEQYDGSPSASGLQNPVDDACENLYPVPR